MIHRLEIAVTPEVIDGNGHVNNVEYIRWMQQAAISHSDAAGCSRATLETGASIQVPLFLESGTKVKVDTRDGSYLGRVND